MVFRPSPPASVDRQFWKDGHVRGIASDGILALRIGDWRLTLGLLGLSCGHGAHDKQSSSDN